MKVPPSLSSRWFQCINLHHYAKVVSNEPAAKEGGLHSIVLSVDAETAAGYVKPGQFIQMRMSEDGKPAFIAIASPPTNGGAELEFLVRRRCRLTPPSG